MLLQSTADFDFASDVNALKLEVKHLNKCLQEQKDINENLYGAIKNLTDVIRDQNELLLKIGNRM